jgi:iron complex transport system substrate-binding protein
MRIVSLLPAATEIVCALGLADDLVGVSSGCDFPPGIVGRATATDLRVLARLRPDLVLLGGEGATSGRDPGADAALRSAVGPAATFVTLTPTSLEGIFHAIATVGAMTDSEDEAVGLVEILRERLADLEDRVADRRHEGHHAPRVVALDGLDPPARAGLWVPEQVRRAGGWDVVGSDGDPSAAVTWEAVVEVDPEMLLLIPRGLHLAAAVRAWRAAPRPPSWTKMRAVRRGRVFVLDGAAYFSRGGPRVIDGIEILAGIFDPPAFADLAAAGRWVPVR